MQEQSARSIGLLEADQRLVPNVHGLSLLIDDDKNRTPVFKAEARVLARPDELSEALVELGKGAAGNLGRAKAGMRILNSALISNEPLSKLVLALSAVEELGQSETWTSAQTTLLEDLAEQAQVSKQGTSAERQEVADALRRGTHRVSLRQGVLRVLNELELTHLQKEWDRIYGRRSGIFHGTERLSDEEIAELANHTVKLRGRVVLAVAKREGAT